MAIKTTHVSYDEKRIIPAPLISIDKSYNTSSDGTLIGSIYNITVNGMIFTDKGSPNKDGTFWESSGFPPDTEWSTPPPIIDQKLGALMKKQEALRKLFSTPGKLFEVQSADGSTPLKFNPRAVSISFPEGQWVDYCNYTITMEVDKLYPLIGNLEEDELIFSYKGVQWGQGDSNLDYHISSASENWTIDIEDRGDQPYYRVSHALSANGKRFYNENGDLVRPAYMNASGWVNQFVGLGLNESLLNSNGLNGLNAYNHIKNVQIDELGGSYSVNESWIFHSGNFIEDFDISSSFNQSDGLYQVSINGNITGLESRNMVTNEIINTRYEAANVALSGILTNLYNRAVLYTGHNLNIIPNSTTIGRNPIAGTINYQYGYDTRPSNIFTNSLSESISIQDSFGVDKFAVIPVLGRRQGPLLQSIETFEECKRSLNVEVVFAPGSGTTIVDRLHANHPVMSEPQKTELQNLINSLKPTVLEMNNNAGETATQIHVAAQNITWDGIRFSYSLDWVWE